MRLKIITTIEDEYILFKIKSIISVENITSLENIIYKFIDEKKYILFDLSETTFIDSSSLGILVILNMKLEENKKQLLFVNINNDIRRIFKSTGLDKHLHIFDDITSAINSFSLN
ncbi:MAG: STAS domain-containing protein [Spirochaetes bacterium]|nr:STAS domain-containing protein [Spirochaetota bacterium]